MSEAINALLLFLKPYLKFFEEFLLGFYREDLLIFGVPYYRWILFFVVGGFLLALFNNLWGD